eukprot:2692061-Pyramimonas_sp.AAC.3
MARKTGAAKPAGGGAKSKRTERRSAKFSGKKPTGVTNPTITKKKPSKTSALGKPAGKPKSPGFKKEAGNFKEAGGKSKGKDSAPQDNKNKTYNKPHGDLIQVRCIPPCKWCCIRSQYTSQYTGACSGSRRLRSTLVLDWERSRSTKVSDEDRKKVISEISKHVKGKVRICARPSFGVGTRNQPQGVAYHSGTKAISPPQPLIANTQLSTWRSWLQAPGS